MKYSLEQQDAGIVIRIEDAGGQASQFLDAVRNCKNADRQGCAVECGKVAAMEEASQGDAVILRMMPRAGERIEINVVRRCLKVLWKSCSVDETAD